MKKTLTALAAHAATKNQPILALAPMLKALRIEQVITYDECCAMMAELRAATGKAPAPFELSGNEWCALMNLAVARHAQPNTEAQRAAEGGPTGAQSSTGLLQEKL